MFQLGNFTYTIFIKKYVYFMETFLSVTFKQCKYQIWFYIHFTYLFTLLYFIIIEHE